MNYCFRFDSHLLVNTSRCSSQHPSVISSKIVCVYIQNWYQLGLLSDRKPQTIRDWKLRLYLTTVSKIPGGEWSLIIYRHPMYLWCNIKKSWIVICCGQLWVRHMICGRDLWWNIPLHIFHWSYWDSLAVRLYSEIDHIHLSSEAHLLPQVDCHTHSLEISL